MVVAVSGNGPAYISYDKGQSWAESSGIGANGHVDVTMSADGKYVWACAVWAFSRVSSDYGATFSSSAAPDQNSRCCHMSSDGRYRVLGKQSVYDGGLIRYSSDFGATWRNTTSPVHTWLR